jgi:hypothetical protein
VGRKRRTPIQEIPRHAKTPNAPRPVVNKIMHYVQQELAQVLQDRPSPDVVPPTIDLVDVMDSNVAAAYCDHVADPTEANFDRALNRAGLWSVITGMGFMKWVWDPNEKKHCILPCNWFDIFLDPYATDFTKNRYIIHSQFLDPEQVYEAWGVTVKPGAVQKADLARTQLTRGMGSAPVLSGVTVNELWMKPCRKHPRGLYVVWSGTDVLVAPQPLPYNHQRLPFTAIGCIERPDSQYFMSPVTYLRPCPDGAQQGPRPGDPRAREVREPQVADPGRGRAGGGTQRRAGADPALLGRAVGRQAGDHPGRAAGQLRPRADDRGADDAHRRPARGLAGAGAGPRRGREGDRDAQGLRRLAPGDDAQDDRDDGRRGLLPGAGERAPVRERGEDDPHLRARPDARGQALPRRRA